MVGCIEISQENITGSGRDGDLYPRTWGSSQQMAMCKKRPRDIKEVNQGSHCKEALAGRGDSWWQKS